MAGIKDVARRAGVSVGTASNVLNRPHLVRPETRARVEAAIAELGFVLNQPARQLRSGSSTTIAYVLLDARNPFFTDVARGIEEVASTENLTLFLCNSDLDRRREAQYLDQLLMQRVRGVLITAVDYANERLRALPANGVPVVLVDRVYDPTVEAAGDGWCSVGVHDVEGGHVAVTHLIERGHQLIAYAGGPMSTPQVADRLVGARRAMEEAGLDDDQLTVLLTNALTVDEGRRVSQRILGLPARRRPTAVFCANDLLALGVLQHMTQNGVAVPEAMSIVGYDDIEYAAAAAVALTSVHQPRHEIGRTAAQLLLEEAAGHEGHQHRHVEFSPELVVRASTTSPRGRSPVGRRRRRAEV
jgi:LacI family transcriptional regulator